jgi:hypothetical protein
MTAMEEMEQRTREEQQIWKDAQGMRRVLGHHEERGDRKEREQHHRRA